MAKTPSPKPESSKTNGAARTSSGATTKRKPARQLTRRDDDGRFKALANRGRKLGVSRNQAAAGALAVTAVGIGVGLLLNWLRNRDDDDFFSPAAFADGEAMDRNNFDQTRSAGPDAMRDEDGDDWDKIDQALDESFPASDPPSTY
jgi:hypothetical protein